jgi:hypothetical protein
LRLRRASNSFEGLLEERYWKQKKQRGQKRQKALFALFALFAFFASLHLEEIMARITKASEF